MVLWVHPWKPGPYVKKNRSFIIKVSNMDTQSRREFISSTGKATIMSGLGMGAVTVSGKEAPLKNRFIHHVFFWLKDPSSTEDRDKLIAGLKRLTKAKTIESAHIGVPANTNRDVIERSYQVSWLLLFKNATDQEIYQTDPVHLKFIEECSTLWEKVVVYDSVEAVS